MPYRPKPSFPRLDRSHPLAQNIAFDLPFFEGTGLQTSDIVNDKAATYAGTNKPSWVGSFLGNAGNFTGVPDGATGYAIVKSGKILAGLKNITVFAIVKTSFSMTGHNNGAALYCERGTSGNAIWKFDINGNAGTVHHRIQFVHRDDAGSLTFIRDNTIPVMDDGVWHSVALTKAGTSIKIYQDNINVISGTLSGNDTLTESTIKATIGGDIGDNIANFQGHIALMRGYSKTLSSSEIAQLTTDTFKIYRKNSWLLKRASTAGVVGSRRMLMGVGA